MPGVAAFPTPWVIDLYRFQGAGTAQDQSTIGGWLPPRDGPGEAVRVIGWAPIGPSYEDQNTGVAVVKYELYIPPQLRNTDGEAVDDPGPNDYVKLPINSTLSVEYEVVGWPRDYSHGPFGFAPGKVVDLQRSVV